MARIVNLTPHAINLPDRVIEPSGKIIRVSSTVEYVGELDGIRITRTTYGKPGIENGSDWSGELPEQQDGVFYIVSALAAAACPDRTDFLIPNETRRNEKGQIIGCCSLATVDRNLKTL